MRPKAKSPHENREQNNNLIVLGEFLLRFTCTSNNGFQLFLDVLLNFVPEKDHLD